MKSPIQTAKNFFCQASEAERFLKFRHQYLIELAKQYGARFKNFTPDSCDMIFPNKESMEAFEKARAVKAAINLKENTIKNSTARNVEI